MISDEALPTVEQIHAFMAAINAGRAVYGAEPLTKLEYDESTPGNPHNCLSARHLAVLGNGQSTASHFSGVKRGEELAKALGTWTTIPDDDPAIPGAIRAITDIFDDSADWDHGERVALRERFVEAGVID